MTDNGEKEPLSVIRLPSADEAETRAIAAALARQCRAGDCIALRGDLGAGKTAFARGFIQSLAGAGEAVVSPTFTLTQTYLTTGATVWHFDLYRLRSPREVEELGLEEALQSGIALIEWPELIQDGLPAAALNVTLRPGASAGERRIEMAGQPARWQEILYNTAQGAARSEGVWGNFPQSFACEEYIKQRKRRMNDTGGGRREAIEDFLASTAFKDAALHPLAGDASFRRYIRLRKDGATAMLMDAPPEKEDVRPYVAAAEFLRRHGYSAPRIYARREESGLLLLEDLGDDSFTRVLKNDPAQERELYAAAVDVLAGWHDAGRGLARPESLALPRYDRALLLQEACLFTRWYLPAVAGGEAAAALRPEYEAILEDVFSAVPLAADQWVHRDYHADNLMWLPERARAQRVGLLDFQDCVYGDAAYDLVSLLEDARREVSASLTAAMLDRYVAASGVDRPRFQAAYAALGAQRNCKIIGIFSRLAARDGKRGYLPFLPRVWGHLERDLAHPALAPLKAWLDRHVPKERRLAPLPLPV